MGKLVKPDGRPQKHSAPSAGGPQEAIVVSIAKHKTRAKIGTSSHSIGSGSNNEYFFKNLLKPTTKAFLESYHIDSAIMEPMGKLIDGIIEAAIENPEFAEHIPVIDAYVKHTSAEESTTAIPKNLKEAEAAVPGFKQWHAAELPLAELPTFLKQHYGTWLGKGLGRADIRRIDPSLERAVQNYLRNKPLPDECHLPTLKEKNNLKVAKAKVSLGATEDTLRSLGSTLATRHYKGRT